MEPMFKAFLKQIRRIPRGWVATYGDVAYAAGYPGAARQVAWALHSSSRGLPWHRVVGAEGRILLSGEMAFEQRMRLQQEEVRFKGPRVAMEEHHFSFFSRPRGAASSRRPNSKKARRPSRKRH
jgi:methylated-DNA-protein-cysteine methyltransferase-like protein